MFSIVLPVFNVEKYIERCLLSLKKQTYTNFEMIFVDDCGHDQSIRIVERYAENDPRIRIVKNQYNLGTYHARRIGVAYAKGNYIVFLDPDDELELHTLHILNQKIYDEPEVIFFGSRRIPVSKFWQSKPEVPMLKEKENKDRLIIKIAKCRKLSKGTEGKAFNKQYLIRVYSRLNIPHSVKLIYGEDKLLFFGTMTFLNNAVSVNENLYLYHKNNTSITVVNSRESDYLRISQLVLVKSYIEEFRSNYNCNESFKSIVVNNVATDILRMKLFQNNKFMINFKLYYNILKLSKRPSDFIKLMIFIISAGRVFK
ncbi:glycosyltransferase family 2 protein [Morganella morganii]|uniref:Glycosyltransferase family 2 protein n=1 Tax=Morganella morganii TaxID=582 RepID=A0AAE4JU72_MORMO|nr:glycosyltransferase family 2 protein [Morganella morganii]MDS0900462.1 glycosyltransferase family 2 protein [Morganella morganii]QXO58618.1 glycosyltransferase family 2 protein [Morganella morganii]QXO77581.1 glycosyltransferase family 2 protein [Morganella morganii]